MNMSSSAVGKRKQSETCTGSADCWGCCLPRLKRLYAETHNNTDTVSTSDDQYLDDDFSYVRSEVVQLHGDVDVSPDQRATGSEQLSSDHDIVDQIKCLYKQPTILQQGSTQTDLDELLQSLLTEETRDIFQAAPMADLDSDLPREGQNGTSNGCQHSGPTITNVQSALSAYSRDQDHAGLSALHMSSTPGSSSSSLLFSSLSGDDLRAYPSESWLSTNTVTSDLKTEEMISEGGYGSFSNSINALFYKRLHKARNDPKYSLKIRNSHGTAVDDGYKWRKYGQKTIKNSPHPRSYYRCTNPRCCAKKQVERSVEDPETITITYEGLHLHYSYPQIQLRQPANYYHHLQIKEEENQHRLIENAYINIDETCNDRIHSISFSKCGEDSVATQAVQHHHHHQQLPQQQQPQLEFCESKFDGHCDGFGGHINGVVEEGSGGPPRGDGLLQDIVPLGIRNPLSFSSCSSSSSFSSSP